MALHGKAVDENSQLNSCESQAVQRGSRHRFWKKGFETTRCSLCNKMVHDWATSMYISDLVERWVSGGPELPQELIDEFEDGQVGGLPLVYCASRAISPFSTTGLLFSF